MPPRELPIYELENAVVGSLRAQGRLIVQAPTGSGKSTQIPQMLFNHGLLAERGEVVVLQPRRLAARMLAKRVAEEVGTRIGDVVGYQIRLESRVSEKTRIRFVTEGILLRQMSFDATLRGVSAIVFDEFHERHLYGDISLARAVQIQQTTRPDLKIVVMSATLDAGALKSYLAPCEVLVSQGRSFPVRVEYLTKTANFEQEPVWDVAARECARVAGQTSSGDFLVFMPGAYEISRTVQAIQGDRALRDFICFPLHGELPPEQQDRAVARYEARKIIVSTNVAETSLTIDGVTVVIDCGLARVARFDPNRGINTLLIEKISVASADQRAGRAGRTAPGVCVRLWTEREHGGRALQELPEVKRLDLSEVVLTLKASGIDDVGAFPWLEKPDAKGLERAEMLLADLGAVSAVSKERDEGTPPTPGRITEVGRRMLRFPVHPRYARMLIEADARGCVRPVALMAALTQGRSFLMRGVPKDVEDAREDTLGEEHESDFFLLMRVWRFADKASYSMDACRRLGIHAQGSRAVGPLFEQFLEIAEKEGLDVSEQRVDGVAVRKCVLAGFSDQLAKRLDAGTLRCELVHKRKGTLARESAIQKATLLVAAEVSEIGGRGGEVNTLLNLVTAIEEPWLKELFPDDYVNATTVSYDESAKRVVARRERRFRDLVIEAKASADEVPLDAAAALLTQQVLAGNLKLEAWDETVEQWIVRVNRLAEWFPELEVNSLTEADRATLVEQICYGELGYKDIRDKPVMPTLRDWLTAEQLAVIDDYLPERLTMANGRKSRISYAKEGPPVLSARIQELYGVEGKFTLGNGRVPVKIEVLAPNQRPIQVTDDLTNFWREQYPKVKAELSRRYPRHEWR
ncbi:ATP-dependent helicase HrpB [Nibricoccus aquaticus]|uniref:ATP-dependent helicase HrpB n=1 Tax=Nibricoccus aquaticus TaxID=2576891 RepID=A0A290Q9Z7_9BACT|nr:ATP-dependent helicase HrpB [Nibricoccus aquaticus]ATC65479.1 ATP-dependent helicase HrpB [Nibricoccus aquaticus]